MYRPTEVVNNNRSPRQALALLMFLTAFAPAVMPPSAHAGPGSAITNWDAFGNLEYTQTVNNTPPSGTPLAFFSSGLFYNNAGTVTAATGTSGSAPGFNYTPLPGNVALFQTPFITQAQLNAFLTPTGVLQANVTGGALTGQSGSYTYGPALFTTSLPYLTGNSYNQLQSLNATRSNTITFNGFTPVVGANESDIFVTITRTSDFSVAFSANFLSSSTTSLNLPANTLAPSTAYTLELDYSSRFNTLDSTGFNGAAFTAGYDTRTEIPFTTAALAPPVLPTAPEPSSLALLTIGGAALAGWRRVRKRALA